MDFNNAKYLIIGSGFYGAVMAERIANVLKEKVIVIEKRNHIGGNCFSERDEKTGIEVHKYGTHIFHTGNPKVWKYINQFTEFNSYFHQVLTTYKNKVYQMPINLETINTFYNINLKPYEVEDFLKKEIKKDNIQQPKNFEEKAITMIGRPLYEAFIKGYTTKQWQIAPIHLPEAILNRLPFRKNYNESYYFSRWQGIPLHGYTYIFEQLLKNPLISVHLNTDYFSIKNLIPKNTTLIYSGPIDQFFDYKFGKLEWRTLRFDYEWPEVEDYQGTSVMNYAEAEIPFTRIHEPRHLHPEREYPKDKTVIVKEYSMKDDGSNPYYPINNEYNQQLILKYREAASNENNVIISGRLGDYKYYDMHDTINMALEQFENIILPKHHS